MVSPYPPLRDGIAAYALQQVGRLRSEGHDVEVLSPGPSAAHQHLELRGWRGALALAKRVRPYDHVIVQFHPDFFYPQPCPPSERARVSAALTVTFRACRDLEVRVHETDYAWARGASLASAAVKAMWRSVPHVVVHTEAERDGFSEAFGVPRARVEVAAHGAHFVRRTTYDRARARDALAIPPDERQFLAIGFVQPHKGFDRAIRAFAAAGLGERGCRLDIVGSVRVEEADYLLHLDLLHRLADATPGVHVHDGYVSDEEFDRWIVASDVVVLPYRHIWSSGVLERAALYDRPVIATRVGGMEAQARPTTVLVDDDDGLAQAMQQAAGVLGATTGPAPCGRWPTEDVDRETVMSEVRARAAAARGGGFVRVASDGMGAGAAARARSSSAPLRRVPSLALPPPVSGRPGASVLKRLVRRLTAWQLDPIVHQVNHLQHALVDALETLAAERPDGDGPGPAGTIRTS